MLPLFNDIELVKMFRLLDLVDLPIYGRPEDMLRYFFVRDDNGGGIEYTAPIRTPYYKLLIKGQRNAWDDWLEEASPDEKWRIAATIGAGLLIAFFHYFLPPATSAAGIHWSAESKAERLRVRQRSPRSQVERLEQLGEKIVARFQEEAYRRSSVSGKFYRDHVDHALRVMLLANYLAWEIHKQVISVRDYENLYHWFITDGWEFRSKVWLPLVLSSLYHDMAYPISDPGIYATHKEELDDFYDALKRENRGRVKYYLSRISHSFFREGSQSNRYLEQEFRDAFYKKGRYRKRDHGVLAGIDFLLMFNKFVEQGDDLPEPLWIAAQAMAMHNTLHSEEVMGSIPFEEYPVAYLLILCDELQEWGRPIGEHAPPIMNSIGLKVFLDNDGAIRIQASLDYSRARAGFNPFLQFDSKFKSLRRLSIDIYAHEGPFLDITLHMPRFKVTNDLIVSEESREFYDTGGDIDNLSYFNHLQDTGLIIRTCDCGRITRNAELKTESKPCSIGNREECWTHIFGVRPDLCRLCGQLIR